MLKSLTTCRSGSPERVSTGATWSVDIYFCESLCEVICTAGVNTDYTGNTTPAADCEPIYDGGGAGDSPAESVGTRIARQKRLPEQRDLYGSRGYPRPRFCCRRLRLCWFR